MSDSTFFKEHPNLLRNALIVLVILAILWFMGMNATREATAIQVAHSYITQKYFSAPGVEAPRLSWRVYDNMDGTYQVSATPPVGIGNPQAPGNTGSYTLLIRVKDWKVISENQPPVKE
jgi:hypothetical protein